MPDDLPDIDRSMLRDLVALRRSRDQVSERLSRLVEHQDSVSPEVYERVRRDYEAQLGDLLARAEPLEERAHGALQELRTVLAEALEEIAAGRLRKEELELRHRLGEIDPDRFESLLGEVEQRLDDQTRNLERLAELEELFVAGLGEVDDPGGVGEPHGDSPPTSRVASGSESPLFVQTQSPPLSVSPAASSAPAPVPSLPLEEGGTVVLSLGRARLVPLDPDLELDEFAVDYLAVIGRGPDSHVRIDRSEVSRRHAEIEFTGDCYVVRDLGSQNGTYVNGERIEEHALTDGDRVQVGSIRLAFCTEG